MVIAKFAFQKKFSSSPSPTTQTLHVVNKEEMNDYPLSAFLDGARSATGGVVTFFLGLILGAAIEIFKKRRKPANDGACL
jgi:hypothetical protein